MEATVSAEAGDTVSTWLHRGCSTRCPLTSWNKTSLLIGLRSGSSRDCSAKTTLY